MKLVAPDISLFASDRKLICFCRHSAFSQNRLRLVTCRALTDLFLFCFETEMDVFTARYELYL